MFLCPALAACLDAHRRAGSAGVRQLLAGAVDVRRIPPGSGRILSLFLMPAVLAAAYGIMAATGMPLPEKLELPLLQAPALFVLFFASAAAEEAAWSGPLLEALRSRTSALASGVAIGVIWAVWHLVPWAQGGRSWRWIAGQALFTVAFRVMLVRLFDLTGGVLATPVVAHAAYNVAWQLFPNRGSHYDPWLTAALTALVAAFASMKTRTGTRRSAARPDPPDRQVQGVECEPSSSTARSGT